MRESSQQLTATNTHSTHNDSAVINIRAVINSGPIWVFTCKPFVVSGYKYGQQINRYQQWKNVPSIYRLFMGISEPIMARRYLSRSSVQHTNTKGRERSVIPWVRRPERPATVKVSYLSALMTRFDVSPFISEPRSTSLRLTHKPRSLPGAMNCAFCC